MKREDSLRVRSGLGAVVLVAVFIVQICIVGDRTSAGPVRLGGVPPSDNLPKLGDPGLDGGGERLDGGAGEWEPPTANTSDPDPDVEILTLNESQEAYIPHWRPESYENLSKPDPNFIVENVNTGRTLVQYGTVVIVNAIVNNTGYVPVQYINVSFYDGPPLEDNRFASVVATFDGFVSKVSAAWMAFGLGIHNLSVVADPDDEIRELDEEDNSNQTTITVVSYFVGMPPDVIPNTEKSEPSGLPVWNVVTTIKVTVSNVGGSPAENLTVVVVDTSVGQTLDTYTIAFLSMTGDYTRYVSWTPSVSGLVSIEVAVDTYNNVTEGNEFNNVADLLLYVMSSPPIPTDPLCRGYNEYHQNEFIVHYGNVVIAPGTTCTFVNSQVAVYGNVQVYGRLNLWQGTSLSLRSMFPGVSPYLDVYSGGYLDSSSSTITALYSSLFVVSAPSYPGFVFRAFANSNMYLANSKVYSPTRDSRTGKSGIQIETSLAGITYTTVAYGREDGVSCSSATPASFIGNTVERNVKTGINLYLGCALSIQGGFVQYNDIGVSAISSATITGVTTRYNRYSGIWISQASPSVIGSTILNNGRYGIKVEGFSSPTISSNVKITTPGEIGVAVNGAESVGTIPTIEANQLIAGNRIGVYVEGTQARVLTNTFEDNLQGLLGEGTELRAESNDFTPYPPGTLPYTHRFGYVEVKRPSSPGIPETPSSTNILLNEFHGASDRPGTGISMDGSLETLIEDNDFDNFHDNNFGTWAMMVAQSSNINITENHLSTYVRALILESSTGVLWKNAFHQRDRYPDISYPVATGGCGLFIEHSSESEPATLFILANWINFTGYSIYLARSSPWIEWNQIVYDYYSPTHKFRDYDDSSGVRYDDLDRGAILVYDGSSPRIRQNYLEGNAYGISLESGLEGGVLYPCNPIIEHNTIVLNGYQAIATGERASLYDLNSAIIRNNVISRSSGAGIVTSSRAKIEVYSNDIEYTNGVTLLCNRRGEDACPTVYSEYWAAVKIHVPYLAVPVLEQWISVHDNNLRYGNQSGVWIARGTDLCSPYNSVEIFSNPEIRDYVWGIVDEGPRAHNIDQKHEIHGNTLWRNNEGIQIKGNGMPLVHDNTIFGPLAEKPESKGITFYGTTTYGTRDLSHAYVYDQYNDIHDVNIGIFVYDTTYASGAPTLTIKADNHVTISRYGIVSETDEGDCADALQEGSAFDIIDSYFMGLADYGLYTRCASPQIKGSDPSGWSQFVGNQHGGFIYDHDHGRSGLYPTVERSILSQNIGNGLYVKSTTVEVISSQFESNQVGVVSTGTVVFDKFWDSDVQENANAGIWLDAGASGIIGKDPYNPSSMPSRFGGNGQGVYAQQTSIQVRENNFDDDGLAIHLRGDDAPIIIKNTISSTVLDPCDSETRRDGIYIWGVNPPSENLWIEENTVGGSCYGIHIINSGMGDSGANGRWGGGYGGWTNILNNEVSNGKGQGGFYVEGSKVVSNGDKVLEHRNRMAVFVAGATGFEAYEMQVTAYPPSPAQNINALGVSGTAYFSGATFESLPWPGIPLQPGGALTETNGGGTQTFEGVSITPIYPQTGMWVRGGTVNVLNSEIPKTGSASPDKGIFINYASVTVDNTRIRAYSVGIQHGYPVYGPGVDLTVRGSSDIQAAYAGIYLHSYTGTVLIENSNIHDCTLAAYSSGILHADTNADGTALISGNTITGNRNGIYVADGRPDIKDNTIEGNQVGISIMGGAPHIYGEEGVGNGNVITENTQYGIYIAAEADVANLKIEWNDITGNSQGGIEAQDPGGGQYFYGKCNWWGDADGPDDDSPAPPDMWDNDPGQDIGNYFWYRDPVPPPSGPQLWWLREPMQTALVCGAP